MRKRLVGLFASTMFVFAACQGAATARRRAARPSTPPAVDRPGGLGSAASGLGRRRARST